MQQINGYFQIEYRGKDGFCHIFPPIEGGESVDVRSLASFLDMQGFKAYNLQALNVAINSNTVQCVPIGPGDGYDIAASLDVFIDENKMTATVVAIPPSLGYKSITVRDIMSTLNHYGVIYGLDQEIIMDFVKNPVYCTKIVMARGKEPVQGMDARIEYMFNTHPSLKPAYNEDGTVDFHSIDVINHIQAGDVLAILHPEDRGTPGRNLMGKDVAPRAVNSAKLKVGRDITVSEDGIEAKTNITGQVRLYGDQIFVSSVYEIPADVDNSTGDIDFEGTVLVHGSIREGFKVSATEDIIVEGSVEGALVIAGGNIVIKRGINGMFKGVLESEGDIAVKFIENAKVFAKGNIETGSIIQSDVTAKGNIIVSDRKGFITGGVVKCGGNVKANTIGSEMGGATRIEVGVDPTIKKKFSEAAASVERYSANVNKIAPVVKTYADALADGKSLDEKNQEYYVKLLTQLSSDQRALRLAQSAYERLSVEVKRGSNSSIAVRRDIYPGVELSINDIVYNMKDKRSFVSIVAEDGEIKFNLL